MNDPLEIMDEIEKDERNLYQCIAGFGIENHAGWQAIRKAIEAQAEYMVQRDARIVKLEARIARLEECSLALINYVEDYNPHTAAKETHRLEKALRDVINETERQSLAAVKAEALREYAEHKREQAIEAGQGARRCRCNRMASNAEAYAERIEQEAKE